MQETKNAFSTRIGGIFLVAGTCVGGGMLALPIDTAKSGFWPSLLALLIGWVYMSLTGLLIIEANLWMKERGAHLVTMAETLIGQGGKYLVLFLYCFMGYASLIAYNAAGAPLVQKFLYHLGFDLSLNGAIIAFALFFGSVFYLSAKKLSNINTMLVVGMIVAYMWILVIGVPGLNLSYLSRADYSTIPLSMPLILTTFSYQMMAPSLVPYMNNNRKDLRRSIVLGTFIPFVAYALWQLIVFGIVPLEAEHGLLEALKEGQSATVPLSYYARSTSLAPISNAFAFFALVTSFIGIGFGLFGFLSDLTHLKRWGKDRVILAFLVLFPTLLITLLYPNIFLIALDLTGGFGDTILSGLIPIGMVVSGRYFLNKEGKREVPGGIFSLILLALFSLYVLFVQTLKLVQ